MNFLKMAQEVRHRSGVQGTGPSSVDTTSYDKIFATLVNDAWVDIQDSKIDWKWMRTPDSFQTVVNKTAYTPTDIFGPNDRFRRYDKDSFFITVNSKLSPLKFRDYEYYNRLHMNDVTAVVPYEFSYSEDSTRSIVVPKPDAIYAITFYYYKTPQQLTTNTDIPECPEEYHRVLVYSALATYAASVGLSGIQQTYAQLFAENYDAMVRDQVPKRVYKVRGIA